MLFFAKIILKTFAKMNFPYIFAANNVMNNNSTTYNPISLITASMTETIIGIENILLHRTSLRSSLIPLQATLRGVLLAIFSFRIVVIVVAFCISPFRIVVMETLHEKISFRIVGKKILQCFFSFRIVMMEILHEKSPFRIVGIVVRWNFSFIITMRKRVLRVFQAILGHNQICLTKF